MHLPRRTDIPDYKTQQATIIVQSYSTTFNHTKTNDQSSRVSYMSKDTYMFLFKMAFVGPDITKVQKGNIYDYSLINCNYKYCPLLWLATSWKVRVSNPDGARFSAPVQTGPEAHPASYKIGK
jgi:hypothetical protein